jgi:hypothetical protein
VNTVGTAGGAGTDLTTLAPDTSYVSASIGKTSAVNTLKTARGDGIIFIDAGSKVLSLQEGTAVSSTS